MREGGPVERSKCSCSSGIVEENTGSFLFLGLSSHRSRLFVLSVCHCQLPITWLMTPWQLATGILEPATGASSCWQAPPSGDGLRCRDGGILEGKNRHSVVSASTFRDLRCLISAPPFRPHDYFEQHLLQVITASFPSLPLPDASSV